MAEGGGANRPPERGRGEPAGIDLDSSDLDWLLAPPSPEDDDVILGADASGGAAVQTELPGRGGESPPPAGAGRLASASQGTLASVGATASPLLPARAPHARSLRAIPWLAGAAVMGGLVLAASLALRAAHSSAPEGVGALATRDSIEPARATPASATRPGPSSAPLAPAPSLGEGDGAERVASPVEPPLTGAERDALETRFVALVDAARWPAAHTRMNELLRRAPDFFQKKQGRGATVKLLISLAHVDPAAADQALRALATSDHPGGLEIVLNIALYRGGTRAQVQAITVLQDPELSPSAVPDLALAVEFYRAGCDASAELHQRAAERGGANTVQVLLSAVDRCGHSFVREQALTRLKRKLYVQERR